MSNGDDRDAGKALLVGGVAGGVVALVNRLLTPRPALAAEERWNELLESQAAIILLLEQLITSFGAAPELKVSTPWVARDPEQICSQPIRAIGIFYSDSMVNWITGKRLLLKVESSLDQAVTIQVIGNYVDDTNRAVNINAPIVCAANSNTSIGLAWDDWHPFIGVRMTTIVAPTTGFLNIWAVIQE